MRYILLLLAVFLFSCTKQSTTQSQINNVNECKLGKMPGIVSSSMNADGSIVYQFSKLSFGNKVYSGGTLTSVNGSMAVYKTKTIFWAGQSGSSMVVRCPDVLGNILEVNLLCPDECGSCDCVPPPCPKSFTTYQ